MSLYHENSPTCNTGAPSRRRRALLSTAAALEPAGASPQPRRHPRQPERLEHQALMQRLDLQLPPDAYCWHVPMGGRRTAITGALMKSLGARAGMPDIMILMRGKTFGLELKSATGRVSDAQKECHRRLREAGATVAIAGGLDEAVSLLQAWGILPGATS